MGTLMMLRLGLVLGAMAVVGGFVWDYQATKSALADVRLELSAEKEARRFADEARNVAIAERDRQAERDVIVRTRTIEIRKRPDGDEIAADILLDTIGGLRPDEGGVQASDD